MMTKLWIGVISKEWLSSNITFFSTSQSQQFTDVSAEFLSCFFLIAFFLSQPHSDYYCCLKQASNVSC